MAGDTVTGPRSAGEVVELTGRAVRQARIVELLSERAVRLPERAGGPAGRGGHPGHPGHPQP